MTVQAAFTISVGGKLIPCGALGRMVPMDKALNIKKAFPGLDYKPGGSYRLVEFPDSPHTAPFLATLKQIIICPFILTSSS